jgi:glycosyltransferase involved in cell wall biosynthesis
VIGFVIIGRNEGLRLQRCLQSIPKSSPCVYVDSGSTDNSVAIALAETVHVEHLDPAEGFTAAKARNIGWRRLLATQPTLDFVHFIDGDCELFPKWLEHALGFLEKNALAVVVCGRRKERYPEASIYNLLCDFEWNTPVGKAAACGGDMLIRSRELIEVNGYRDSLIAGEEPEMCLRLRAKGAEIWRLDHDMTLHDAAMTKFSQWFKRSMRAGFAFAEGRALHNEVPWDLWKKECRSSIFWGLALPFIALATILLFGPIGLFVLSAYPVQWLRIAMNLQGSRTERCLRAFFLLLGKLPEVIGYSKFHLLRMMGAKASLIEYK